MDNNNIELTPASYIKTLKILHFALFSGILLFGTVIFLQTKNWTLNWNETENVLFFIVPITAILGLLSSNIITKKRLELLTNEKSLTDKLTGYRAISIIRLALIEAPTLFSIVAFLLSENLYFLLIAGALTIYFFMMRPTKNKTINDLKLSIEHRHQFSKSDEKII